MRVAFVSDIREAPLPPYFRMLGIRCMSPHALIAAAGVSRLRCPRTVCGCSTFPTLLDATLNVRAGGQA